MDDNPLVNEVQPQPLTADQVTLLKHLKCPICQCNRASKFNLNHHLQCEITKTYNTAAEIALAHACIAYLETQKPPADSRVDCQFCNKLFSNRYTRQKHELYCKAKLV